MKVDVLLRAKLGANLWQAPGAGEGASNSKARYFLRTCAKCRGGGCAAKVLDLTGGRPVDADPMITTILRALAKPRGEVMRSGVADEPVVVVKRSAEDLHGDMRRGENRAEARLKPALGKKRAVEAKGGTYGKADDHSHAGRRDLEKAGVTRSNHRGKERATYVPLGVPWRKAIDPSRHRRTERDGGVRWNS